MKNKIIIILISFAISLGLVFFALLPRWSSIKILRANIQELDKKEVEIQNLLAKSRELEQKYFESEEAARKIFLALPKNKDISYLLVQFEGLTLQNGLLLEEISFAQANQEQETRSQGARAQSAYQGTEQSVKLPEGVLSLPVNISVSGSYEAFKGYLNSLENNVRWMDIKQIGLSSAAKSESESLMDFGVFNFDLEVSAYYKP